jgi:hypothetical protein
MKYWSILNVKAIEWSIPQFFDFIRDKNDPQIDAKYVKLKLLGSLVVDARNLHKQWADKASEFRRNYGEGMVVGVLLGGIGQANMTVVNQAEASAWKYGGAAKFSYAGLASSVAVEATYDASGTRDMSKVRVQCMGGYSGACVAGQVKSWTNKLNDKAFAAAPDFWTAG